MWGSPDLPQKRRLLVTLVVYMAATLFCVLFHVVYIRFSYGEDSPFLRGMFLCPLLGGVVPAAVLLPMSTRLHLRLSRAAFNLWNSGVATLAFGCLVRAVVNISGRFTDYDKVYWVAGGFLLCAALVVQTASSCRRRRHINEPPEAIR